MKYMLFLLFIGIQTIDAQFEYVDFDMSMQRSTYEYVINRNEHEKSLYDFFKNKYELLPIHRKKNQAPIPHIIHQIWLGHKEKPEFFDYWQASWRIYHPDWLYILWTDEDAARFPFINKQLFEQAQNPGEKSDIWRYEILFQFGGLYVDVDYECLQPFDELTRSFDFFIGLQPLDTHRVQVGIGLIGCIPKHPTLAWAIRYLPHQPQHIPIVGRTGPLFFTLLLKQIPECNDFHDAILPASYLYPLEYKHRGAVENLLIPHETYAIHHWCGSWLK